MAEEKQEEKQSESVFSLFEKDRAAGLLPYFIYVAILGVIYIANSHFGERTSRKINKLKSEVEELRIDYTTLKAEYTTFGKRTEISRRVKAIGLIDSDVPAYELKFEDED